MAINKAPVVIKFGGDIFDDHQSFHNLLQSIKSLYKAKQKVILVHGGGPQTTALSKKLSIIPKKVGGRRITDQETLEVVKMVLPGICNTNVLAGLKGEEVPAVSVSGISIITAHLRPPKQVTGSKEIVDFGFVGDVDSCDPSLLNSLLQNNYVPVVSPLCANNAGIPLNINADTIASHIALAVRAKSLMLVTKVGGVFEDINNPHSRLHQLSIEQAKEKIAQGVIIGGMIPKIEESFKLLQGAVQSVHIVGVESATALHQEMQSPGSIGTAILAD